MIKSYKYYISCHSMLHYHIMEFFNRIEFKTGSFDDDFFDDDFKDIVKKHPKVLRKRCENIYEEFKKLSQAQRSNICLVIRRSNDIENICNGLYIPKVIDNTATGINKMLKDFFLGLYSGVLNGKGFKEKYNTTLRDHFDGFCRLNREITLCPICGISELKKEDDDSRDQYDHFLPKGLYPFSSVNFENLVPSCTECNSFNAKGDKDTILVSTGTLFYPFDINHKGISIEFHIENEKSDGYDWKIEYTNPDGNGNKIQSWRNLYNIDSRYLGLVKARIEKWYKHYWSYLNNTKIQKISINDRNLMYNLFLDNDEEFGLSFIRKPALKAFIHDPIISKAVLEAEYYS